MFETQRRFSRFMTNTGMKIWQFVLLFVTTTDSVDSDIIEQIGQICPYSTLCTVGSRRNFSQSADFSPCCAKCFCDEKCWSYNDCCPDVQIARPEKQPEVTCALPAVKNRAYDEVGYETLENIFPTYQIIGSCPRDWNGSQTTNEKCEGIFTSTPSLDDLVIVSNSLSHDEIYKNKHCAVCHGVRHIIRWDLRIASCPEVAANNVPASVAMERIWNSCLIFSTVPAHVRFTRSVINCHDVISECQSTKDSVSEDTKRLCEEGFYAPVYVLRALWISRYKNPFCVSCNPIGVDKVKQVCHKSLLSEARIVRGGRISFLIKPEDLAHSFKLIREPRRTCMETEIFDPTTDSCRILHCPWNFLVHHGQCLQLGKGVAFGNVVIRFLFRPIKQIVTGKIREYSKGQQKDIARKIEAHFFFTKCDLLIMTIYAYRLHNDDHLSAVILLMKVGISNSCPFDYIANTSLVLSRNHRLTLAINNHSVPLIGQMYFSERIDLEDLLDPSIYEEELLLVQWGSTKYPYMVVDFFLCPYFKFNLSEYNSLMRRMNRRTLHVTGLGPDSIVNDQFYVLPNATMAICTSSYFRLFEQDVVQSGAIVPYPANFPKLILVLFNVFVISLSFKLFCV